MQIDQLNFLVAIKTQPAPVPFRQGMQFLPLLCQAVAGDSESQLRQESGEPSHILFQTLQEHISMHRRRSRPSFVKPDKRPRQPLVTCSCLEKRTDFVANLKN